MTHETTFRSVAVTEVTDLLKGLLEYPIVQALVIVLGAVLLALLARQVFHRVVSRLVSRTRTSMDDSLVGSLRGPLVVSILLLGFGWAVLSLELPPKITFVLLAAMKTVAVIVWSRAMFSLGTTMLDALSQRIDSFSWIQPKTMPLLDMVLKVVIVAGFLYFALIAWNLNITSWLASAGIAGIAIGFAAKDTLANLFAGMFIVADAPYKIGDFVVLDNQIRGQVMDIGIRSTRILTRDDVEITVPNAVIANAKIVNETGGPHQKMRIRVKVSVAYGSDVDQVCEVLMGCTTDLEHGCTTPVPRVRFRALGESGLDFELLVWVDEPVYRGLVLHELNTRVYNALNQAGIEIPYPKLDIYLKQIAAQDETK